MFGKSLLDRGILWRVGTGEQIRITKDKWIPDAPCHPILPSVQMPDDLKVSALMDESSRQWNEELVRICFRPLDVERILNIPLSLNRVPNCVSWPFTKTGTYTVKSAYIMAKSEAVHLKASVKGKGESSDQVCCACWNLYGFDPITYCKISNKSQRPIHVRRECENSLIPPCLLKWR
jgi:hypothetical protein